MTQWNQRSLNCFGLELIYFENGKGVETLVQYSQYWLLKCMQVCPNRCIVTEKIEFFFLNWDKWTWMCVFKNILILKMLWMICIARKLLDIATLKRLIVTLNDNALCICILIKIACICQNCPDWSYCLFKPVICTCSLNWISVCYQGAQGRVLPPIQCRADIILKSDQALIWNLILLCLQPK